MLRFHIKVKSSTEFFFLSFNAYWCSKSTFSKSWRGRCILGWHIVRLVRYIGSYGISPFSPQSRYPLFRPRKINWIIKNLEREVQLDPFLGGDSNYYYQLEEFMVGLIGLLHWSIQAPFKKNQVIIYLFYIIKDSYFYLIWKKSFFVSRSYFKLLC